MKILIISPSNTFPALSGGAVRTNALLKYLAKENEIFYVYNKYHQVKEVREEKIKSKTKFSNVKLYSVGPSIRAAQLFNPLLLMKSYNIIKKEKIDLIIGEFAWSGAYLLLLKFLTRIPYVIDGHNIEYELVRFNYGLIGKLISPIVYIYEKTIWKFSKYVFCVSENDKRAIACHGINNEKITVIPHGIEFIPPKRIDKKRFKKKCNISLDEPIILFFGKLDYSPNKESVYIIYKELLPRVLKKRKKIKFLIVGSNPPKIKHKNIVFTGPVKDVRDYVHASDIVINPILQGTGKRSKIIEAISWGKKVISTTIGAGELVNENLKDFLIISNDWNDFANQIIKNLETRDKRPPKEVFKKYLWKNIIDKINSALEQKDKN